MEHNQQLFIIDDLGIPKEEFEQKWQQAALQGDVIWDAQQATAEKVSVIMTVNKAVGKQLLNTYPNVKLVCVAFTGFDHVDLDYCQQNNIAVYNVPTYATHSVAELAVGLSISLLRDIPHAHNTIHDGNWQLQPGFELAGKVVGILGTGTIGLATATLFHAFGCKLIGWSRTEKEAFKQLGGKYVANKQSLFAEADIVSIHLPLNEETRGLIGKEDLSAMKSTAYVVNTARGPIIKEDHLLKTLQNKAIAGAAIDVFEQEPLESDHPFRTLSNMIVTPHIAYKTKEALKRRMAVTVNNIAHFTTGNETNRVA